MDSSLALEMIARASPLSERMTVGFGLPPGPAPASGSVRLERWKERSAHGDGEAFLERLVADGLNHDLAERSLQVPLLSDQPEPQWSRTIRAGLEHGAKSGSATKEYRGIHGKCYEKTTLIPFQEALLPFVQAAREQITERIPPAELLSEDAFAALEIGLLLRLSSLMAPSLGFEFSLFRDRHRSLADIRVESTGPGRERYRSFVADLLSHGLKRIFCDYPVLARLAGTVCDHWVGAISEFLLRLGDDQALLGEHFANGNPPGCVQHISGDISDAHHHGRNVYILTFASGLKLVYKPRDLSVDQAFVELVAWVNRSAPLLPLKAAAVLPRNGYGWVEFITSQAPCGVAATRDFHLRAGMLLCLAYLLEATDLHHGNVVVSGEHPVLVDIETLLQHRTAHAPALGPAKVFDRQISNSVLRTLLLPIWASDSKGGVFDCSGLGGFSGEHKPALSHWGWKDVNTDAMDLVHRDAAQLAANEVLEERISLDLKGHTNELLAGFERMYRLIMERRGELLAEGGPLVRFRGIPVRFVFRSTEIYTTLLARTNHPQHLRDGADRSIELDILYRGLRQQNRRSAFWPIVRSEIAALERFDVPRFEVITDSRDLRLEDGQVVEGCFPEASFARVVAGINAMGESGLEEQLAIIRGSLHCHFKINRHQSAADPACQTIAFPATLPNPSRLVELASDIANELTRASISAPGGSVNWISPQFVDRTQRCGIGHLGFNLFDGRCGVAVFMAALARIRGDEEAKAMVHAILAPLTDRLDEPTGGETLVGEMGIGGITGIGSVAYALSLIGTLLQDRKLVASARRGCGLITRERIAADGVLDLMSGSAGAALALLAVHRLVPDPELLARARACGHHLLASRTMTADGWHTWPLAHAGPLSGMSHGSIGISFALERLYRATGDEEFRAAVRSARPYERMHRKSAREARGHRLGVMVKSHSNLDTSWCHGVAGLGLALIQGAEDEQDENDLSASLVDAMGSPLQQVDTLCCGDLGVIEFLFSSGRKLGRRHLCEDALGRCAQVLARREKSGHFLFGHALTFLPSFFQGAAGIGYQLLRMAEPGVLPSVLTLDPPA